MALRTDFLEAMSRTATTVSVVTTDGPGGRSGVTVSAMTSLSADAASPSLIVCVNDSSATARAIQVNGCFCVNILHQGQIHLSDVFAGRHKARYPSKFDCAEWFSMDTGAPAAKEATANLDCTLHSAQKHGTHWILIGAVRTIEIGLESAPLIYVNRGYGSHTPTNLSLEQG